VIVTRFTRLTQDLSRFFRWRLVQGLRKKWASIDNLLMSFVKRKDLSLESVISLSLCLLVSILALIRLLSCYAKCAKCGSMTIWPAFRVENYSISLCDSFDSRRDSQRTTMRERTKWRLLPQKEKRKKTAVHHVIIRTTEIDWSRDGSPNHEGRGGSDRYIARAAWYASHLGGSIFS